MRGSSALILHTIFRLRVDGLENLPREGGIVLAPMHRSYIDTLAVGAALKKRRFRAMAKYELFFVPLIGRAIAMGGAFPVRRGVQDMEAYATAMRMLREGRLLLVFPEGTRNRHGKARPQLGAALLALDAGAAFVPIAIAGTDRIRCCRRASRRSPSSSSSRSGSTTCRPTTSAARRTPPPSAGRRRSRPALRTCPLAARSAQAAR